MTFLVSQDPRVQPILFRKDFQFVESLVELEVLTNPLEIDVEIPEPLVTADIPAEFSVTVDVDSEFEVTIDVVDLVVTIDIIELIVSIEDCDV